jgi:hypothetical protein
MSDVTVLIERLEQGDGRAVDQLLPLVYEELRCLATSRLAREETSQTLRLTDLLHETGIGSDGMEVVQVWDANL